MRCVQNGAASHCLWVALILMLFNLELSGGLQVCDTGNSPISGSQYRVCRVNDNELWLASDRSGSYYMDLICDQYGYLPAVAWGGTCGTQCGYCGASTISCSNTGVETFSGNGGPYTDANGRYIRSTVHWKCGKKKEAATCDSGCSPVTNARYTVCTASDSEAWIGHGTFDAGGTYYMDQICNDLGYKVATAQGGTFGSICGLNSVEEPYTCRSRGTKSFDGGGSGGTNPTLGRYIGSTVMWRCGGRAAACNTGNDPVSGAQWVVCSADSTGAWIGHAQTGGGTFHMDYICNKLGYLPAVQQGGTCGTICGYCDGTRSCTNRGPEVYDGGGGSGADATYGRRIAVTVMWKCGPRKTCGSTSTCQFDCGVGSYDAGSCTAQDCRTCSSVSCPTNQYMNSARCAGLRNGCSSCNEINCGTNQFQLLSACGPNSQTGCRNCGTGNCGSNQYYVASLCRSRDSGCRTCTSSNCGSGTYYLSSGCSGTNNGCSSCSTVQCSAGQYQVISSCGGTSNGCFSCSAVSCASGQYQDLTRCSGTDNGCRACNVVNCGGGSYQNTALCANRDTGCRTCSVNTCSSSQYYIASNCVGVNNGCRACSAVTCPSGQFQAGCGGTNDGCQLCSAVTCPNGQWRNVAACSTSSNGCTACPPLCSAGTWQTQQCGGTNTRICTDCLSTIQPPTDNCVLTSCTGTNTLVTPRCTGCGPGFYIDVSFNVCRPVGEGCVSGSSPVLVTRLCQDCVDSNAVLNTGDPNTADKCGCAPGFEQGPTTCEALPKGCRVGSLTGGPCAECWDASAYVNGDGCLCPPGKYDVLPGGTNVQQCEFLNKGCRSGNLATCTQCMDPVRSQVSGGECVCKDTYFDARPWSDTLTCERIGNNCKVGTPKHCLECIEAEPPLLLERDVCYRGLCTTVQCLPDSELPE